MPSLLLLLCSHPALALPALALPTQPLVLSQTLTGSWPGGDYGSVLVSAGDVDLNGKPDLLVGIPFAGSTDTGSEGVGRGRVVLYLAASDNSGYTGEAWTVEGSRDNGHYGGALAGGEDIDGDGFADVVVGSTYLAWQVDLFTGGETGLSSVADWSMDGGGGHFGRALALIGDMDGDGYSELAIGDSAAAQAGEVTIYLGSSTGPQELPITVVGDDLHPIGGLVARAGDVDGDGLADLLTGPEADASTASALSVYRGDAGGDFLQNSSTLSVPPGLENLGVSGSGGSASAEPTGTARSSWMSGDIDGDGFGDVVVGADGAGSADQIAGAVAGWAGGAEGPGSDASWISQDAVGGTYLGRSVAVVGDVDGDGFADVLAGRPGYGDDTALEGGALLLMGSSEGLSSDPAWQASSGLDPADHGGSWIGFGQAVVGLGDINGDDHADVAVGATNTGSADFEGRLGSIQIYTGTDYQTPQAGDPTGGIDTAADSGDGGQVPQSTGCGCAASSTPGLSLWWLPSACVALVWKRRRRQRAPDPSPGSGQSTHKL